MTSLSSGVRTATYDDAQYMMQAAVEFCDKAGLSFDPESFADSLFEIMNSTDHIVLVYGKPATGHCAAHIRKSMYDAGQTIVQIFSTWGKGGLKCFREIQRRAEDSGYDLLMADSYLDGRMASFYQRQGLTPSDRLYIGRL